MVTVTFQCESIQQLRKQMMDFLSAQPQETFPVPPPFVQPINSRVQMGIYKDNGAEPGQKLNQTAEYTTAPEKPFELNVAAPEKKTRTRKAKEAKPAIPDVFMDASEDANLPDPEVKSEEKAKTKFEMFKDIKPDGLVALPSTGGISKETVHQALQQVNVAAGLPKAREILQSFKANRVSEIKESDYRAFVEKCNEAVMMN
jgi:hypothetical protein